MALRKIIASRYSWVETVDGITRYYVGEKGDHWDFAAGEITKGEAEGALAAADGGAVAATLSGQIVAGSDLATMDTRVDALETAETADEVTVQAAHVADPAALTAAAAAGANPTKAEFDALLADVTALRTTVVALLAALQIANGPMAAA